MSDLKRTADGDIAIEGGDFVIVEGVEAITQDIEMTLQTSLGESVYDRLAGMPYEQAIFAPGATPESIRFIVERRLLALDGVTEIVSFDSELDRQTREFAIRGTVRVSTGDVVPFDVSEVLP